MMLQKLATVDMKSSNCRRLSLAQPFSSLSRSSKPSAEAVGIPASTQSCLSCSGYTLFPESLRPVKAFLSLASDTSPRVPQFLWAALDDFGLSNDALSLLTSDHLSNKILFGGASSTCGTSNWSGIYEEEGIRVRVCLEP